MSQYWEKKYLKYKKKYLDLKGGMFSDEGNELVTPQEENFSLIPDSQESQYVGNYVEEGEASNCTYNAWAGVLILDQQMPWIVEQLERLFHSGNIEQRFFLSIWVHILKKGLEDFRENGKNMIDPKEYDPIKDTCEKGVRLHDNPAFGELNRVDCLEKIKKVKFCIFNLAGETVLLYKIPMDEPFYIYVDSHKRDGLKLIRNIEKFVNEILYKNYEETVPDAYFSKET